MQKVRWTQKCAGGCGTVLRLGTYATLLHRGLWCLTCSKKHSLNCRVSRLS